MKLLLNEDLNLNKHTGEKKGGFFLEQWWTPRTCKRKCICSSWKMDWSAVIEFVLQELRTTRSYSHFIWFIDHVLPNSHSSALFSRLSWRVSLSNVLLKLCFCSGYDAFGSLCLSSRKLKLAFPFCASHEVVKFVLIWLIEAQRSVVCFENSEALWSAVPGLCLFPLFILKHQKSPLKNYLSHFPFLLSSMISAMSAPGYFFPLSLSFTLS